LVEVTTITGQSAASLLEALISDLGIPYPGADFEGLPPFALVAQSRTPFIVFEPTNRSAKSAPRRGPVGHAVLARGAHEGVARLVAPRNIRPPQRGKSLGVLRGICCSQQEALIHPVIGMHRVFEFGDVRVLGDVVDRRSCKP